MATWNPRFPLNYRTGVFCFLMGTVLSAPLSAFPTESLLFEPPEICKTAYHILLGISLLTLPF